MLKLYLTNDNVKIMIGYDTKQIFDDLFRTLLTRYKQCLEASLKGTNFVFIGIKRVELQIPQSELQSLNCGGSYIETLK